KVIGTNPAHFASRGKPALDCPVESVSWQDAVDYCQKLDSLDEEKLAGRTYRLPTEAEWEYGCRAGSTTTTTFACGNSLSASQANFEGSAPYGEGQKGDRIGATCPVGQYPPNAFGLYDVHGNVYEWCSDWFSPRYYRKGPVRNPQGPTRGTQKVIRD